MSDDSTEYEWPYTLIVCHKCMGPIDIFIFYFTIDLRAYLCYFYGFYTDSPNDKRVYYPPKTPLLRFPGLGSPIGNNIIANLIGRDHGCNYCSFRYPRDFINIVLHLHSQT